VFDQRGPFCGDLGSKLWPQALCSHMQYNLEWWHVLIRIGSVSEVRFVSSLKRIRSGLTSLPSPINKFQNYRRQLGYYKFDVVALQALKKEKSLVHPVLMKLNWWIWCTCPTRSTASRHSRSTLLFNHFRKPKIRYFDFPIIID
jgi:hypothetical protein